jgi:hypothetical protein
MLNKHIFSVTWWKAYSCVVNVLLFFIFSLSLKITSVHLLGTKSSALMNVNCNCDTFIEHMHGIHFIFRCTYKLIQLTLTHSADYLARTSSLVYMILFQKRKNEFYHYNLHFYTSSLTGLQESFWSSN